MQYLGLVLWTVIILAAIAWGNSFNRRSYNLVGKRNYFFAISAFVLIVCLGSLFTQGLKKGLDFTGGTIVEVGAYEEVTGQQIRDILSQLEIQGLGEPGVQVGTEMLPDRFALEGEPDRYQKVILRLTLEDGTSLQPAQIDIVSAHLREQLGDFKELRTASIGPTISQELANNATKALILSLILQLLYIFVRFGNQLRYGLTADVALLHDVIILVGFYSIAGHEIDSPFVAALLTVAGYSVMDSVVIFDRIRENLTNWWADNPDEDVAPYEEIVNDSLNQTMTRSINTSLTTLVTLLAIYYFGGETLSNFAYSLIVGIVAGVYSSICVAAPVLVLFDKKYPTRRPVAGGSWLDDDEEVVPEHHMEPAEEMPGAQPAGRSASARRQVPPAGDEPGLHDEAPRSGGRKRSRGKRS